MRVHSVKDLLVPNILFLKVCFFFFQSNRMIKKNSEPQCPQLAKKDLILMTMT